MSGSVLDLALALSASSVLSWNFDFRSFHIQVYRVLSSSREDTGDHAETDVQGPSVVMDDSWYIK